MPPAHLERRYGLSGVDTAAFAYYCPIAVPSASELAYSDPKAHALRAEYLASFGGDEIPVSLCVVAERVAGATQQEPSPHG